MDLAKQHLSGVDYTRILSGVPALGAAIAAVSPALAQAPVASSGGVDWLGHISYWTGNTKLGQMAQLAQIFSQLGLSSDMVGKFLKITLDYVQGSGGTNLMGLLAGALKF